ncbi:MAG: hypothetical protein IJ014_00505 [Rikenellaceae bacterium]|nr:hypothetical protein [Rikenellaceae bacterium]
MGTTSCEQGKTEKEKQPIEYTLQLTSEEGQELSEISFGAEGGKVTINVITNGEWQIIPEQAAAEWLWVSSMSGENDGQLTFSASANEVQEARSAYIDVQLNNEFAMSLLITQSAAAPVYNLDVTSISPDPANFGTEGGKLTVTVESNSAWEYCVIPDSEWITQAEKTENTLTLNIAEAGYTERQADIILSSKEDSSKCDTVTVCQERKILFEVTADSTSFGTSASQAKFEIQSNIGWSYEVSPAVEWVSEGERTDNSLTLNIAELSFDSRSVDVIFRGIDDSSYIDTITLTQTGAERIVADMLDVVFNADGTATDISPMHMAITTVEGTQLMTYYNKAYDRYVAHFNNTLSEGTTSSFYKIDFSKNTKFKNALADGHTLEAIFSMDESGKGITQEVKILTAHQAGGTGLMLTIHSRGNDITFLPNVSTTGKSVWRWAESGVVPNPGTYYHVVGVWDKEKNVARVYVNGKYRGSAKTEGDLVLPSGASYQWFGIGTDPAGAATGSNCLKGDVVVARIYDSAMTPEQVAQLYAQSAPVGELPTESFAIKDVAFLSGCELGIGYGYAIYGEGFAAGDVIEFVSTADENKIYNCDVATTATTGTVTIPAGFESGKYRMTVVRGAMRFPLGVTTLTISDTPTIPSKPKVIAHRGVHSSATENSMESFIAAQELDVYGAESDFYITADGRIVSNHDATTNGVKIEATNYDDLPLRNGKKLPVLEEYFEQILKKPTVKLIIEIKNHSSAAMNMKVTDEIVRLIKEYKMEPYVEFIAFNYDICKRIVEQMPEMNVAYLTDNKAPKVVYADGIRGIDYVYERLLTTNRAWIKEAHDLGMYVNIWTVNSAADMMRCIAAGVDFITTDNCPLLQSLLSMTFVIAPEE